MTTRNSLGKLVGAGALALAGMGAGGSAMAQDVYWSVGLASPGVQVAVSNAPAVPYYPRTYVVQPQPIYVQPAPVHHAYPVYSTGYPQVYGPGYGPGYGSGYGRVYGRPVVIAQPPVYTGWNRVWHRGHGHGHGNGHGNGHGQIQSNGQEQVRGILRIEAARPDAVPAPHRSGRH